MHVFASIVFQLALVRITKKTMIVFKINFNNLKRNHKK